MASISRLYGFLGLLLLLQQGWAHCMLETNMPQLRDSHQLGYNSSFQVVGKGYAAVHRKLRASNSCRAGDISIVQGQISGTQIPRFEVQITNTCTDHKCTISNIVVNCGHFSSATFVNPKLFRRLDENAGTCLANDGRSIEAGQGITFTYDEIYLQPMSLKSATVSCFGR